MQTYLITCLYGLKPNKYISVFVFTVFSLPNSLKYMHYRHIFLYFTKAFQKFKPQEKTNVKQTNHKLDPLLHVNTCCC